MVNLTKRVGFGMVGVAGGVAGLAAGAGICRGVGCSSCFGCAGMGIVLAIMALLKQKGGESNVGAGNDR